VDEKARQIAISKVGTKVINYSAEAFKQVFGQADKVAESSAEAAFEAAGGAYSCFMAGTAGLWIATKLYCAAEKERTTALNNAGEATLVHEMVYLLNSKYMTPLAKLYKNYSGCGVDGALGSPALYEEIGDRSAKCGSDPRVPRKQGEALRYETKYPVLTHLLDTFHTANKIAKRNWESITPATRARLGGEAAAAGQGYTAYDQIKLQAWCECDPLGPFRTGYFDDAQVKAKSKKKSNWMAKKIAQMIICEMNKLMAKDAENYGATYQKPEVTRAELKELFLGNTKLSATERANAMSFSLAKITSNFVLGNSLKLGGGLVGNKKEKDFGSVKKYAKLMTALKSTLARKQKYYFAEVRAQQGKK